MHISEDNHITTLMTDHLADLYNIRQLREGIHLSTLVYCLTRSQLDNINHYRVVPTDDEVLLFCLGWGLQDVLTPKSAETPLLEKDGIVYSPDMMFPVGDTLVELKTTRMSAKKGDERNFSETWLEYMKGGCYILNRNDYHLSVLYMVGYYKPPKPVLKSYHFQFTDDELFSNWDYIMERKVVYEDALLTGKIIPPFTKCKNWECEYCRYKLICDTIVMQKKEDKDAE